MKKVENECVKCAIWGSKMVAMRNAFYNADEIDFFVDNDKKQCGKNIFGKPVFHPSECDWENTFVYLPYVYKSDLLEQVKQLGVSEKYIDYYGYSVGVDEASAWNNIEKGINTLETHTAELYGKDIAILPYKGALKSIINALDKMHCPILYFEGFINKAENSDEIDGIEVPGFLDSNVFINRASEEKRIDVDLDDELLLVAEQIKDRHSLSDELCVRNVEYIIYSFEQLATKIQPKSVFIGALNTPTNTLIEILCRRKGIKILSSHAGVLPGTINIDIGGEVGRSLPARYAEVFRSLPISDTDIKLAKLVCDKQFELKLNRKIQPKNDIYSYIISKIKKGRPIVFFAGQNDVESFMVPYSDSTKKFHSPIFHSSIEAGIYLAKLCMKNDWNFIYKPHPMYANKEDVSLLPENVIYLEFGNIIDLIDISDVVVTILSTTAYDALIRKKPVVMLGYNWTKGQGCTYEAFCQNDIENTIKKALMDGYTDVQEQALIENVARLCKYYLYDDLIERDIRFGMEMPTSFDGFFALEDIITKSND